MPDRPVTQGHIEDQIMDICDALESETERYAAVSDLAAQEEADFKLEFARQMVRLAQDTVKRTVQERDARCLIATGDALVKHKLSDARRVASREALLSYRARLDALRTLSANVRAQT